MSGRKGVNCRISRGKERQRWVHHDELLPWRDRDQPVVRRPEASPVPKVIQMDENGLSSSDEERTTEDATPVEGKGLRRSLGNRRPPVWMGDYCI